MARHRDVQAFHDRAPSYEIGWSGRVHGDITARTVDLVLEVQAAPRRVLDVGCGTGRLLRLLAQRLPEAEELAGIDAAQGMIDAARVNAGDHRLQFTAGLAEQLPYADASFDLVVSTTSFDHWKDQRAGLVECARVLAPGGHLVISDLFSLWLYPTMLFGHRGHARTKRRMGALLGSSGFQTVRWESLYAVMISAAVASQH